MVPTVLYGSLVRRVFGSRGQEEFFGTLPEHLRQIFGRHYEFDCYGAHIVSAADYERFLQENL